MKQLFILLLSISSILCTAHAQLLWGTTAGGGQHGIGTISSYNMQSKGISVAKSFESAMSEPVGKLALANNGKYYGVTTYGGDYGYGAIFSYNVATNKVVNVVGFNNTDGSYPTQGLVLAPDGKLYGTTQYGGTDLLGTIYSYDPAMNVITKLFDFKSTTASTPVSGNLLMGNNGKLYGTGEYGGANGYGALYSFDIATNTYATLFDFDWSSGYNMWGSLTGAIDGKLYGTTAAGGNGYGVIYSFDTTTNTFTDVYNFDTDNGWNPLVGLTQAADGNLYGTTVYGGAHNNGVLYCLHPGDNTYTRLHDFNYADGGYPTPNGEMLQASDGKLYGTTGGGIFSYSITDSSYTGVFNFNDTTGSGSQTSFVEGANGNLYDFTQDYGDRVDGSLFSFNINSSHYTTINVFGNQPSNPQGGLCIASDGKMYGMTASGGKYGDGVLYSINPSNSNYTKLMDFNGSNGASPFGNLMQATDGKLYGMTSAGGNNNAGVLFSYDPYTNTYTKLFDFVGVYGVAPKGSLLQASDGELYGMTTYGGTNNEGVIFSYDIPTHGFIQLHNFNHSVDGANPYGDLLEAADGKLYGLTTIGSIFSFDPSTASVTQLYYLPDSKFYGNLIQASDGKFYGLAYTGGAYGAGTIFSYDPATALLTQLHDFNGSDGANPFGSLLQASDGKLYGVTERGGVNDAGVVFSYDITSNSYQLLQSYTGDNGAHPAHFAFVETSAPKPAIKINNVSITEGKSGQKKMNFKVSLSATSTNIVRVNYTTVNKTAKAPGDYTAKSGTLTFNPGEKIKYIGVMIKGDLQVEPDETLKVRLSNAVNATFKDSIGVGTILNDDGTTISNLEISEGIANDERIVIVAPNPANSVADIRLHGYSGNVTIQVLSMEGSVVKTIKTNGTTTSQQINVADLTGGTYFLKVMDEEGYKQTVKMVVAR